MEKIETRREKSYEKKLHEIINQKNYLISEKEKLEKNILIVDLKIKSLIELENMYYNNIDVDKILIANKILRVEGNIYRKIYGEPKTIADEAIDDIANGGFLLKKEYFGNKKYCGYQRFRCEYGYTPSHGSIVDEIRLKDEYRKINLNDKEKDACIYYLKNYEAIIALKNLQQIK